LIGPYLSKREQLAGLVVIMDIRRPLTDLDLRLIDWFRPTGRPIHILLSKADKLSRQEQTKALRSVKAEVATWGDADLYSVQLFSSLKKTGVEEAERCSPAGWRSKSRRKKTKGPRIRGVRGPKCLNVVKAPAQGGEAGDSACHLLTLTWVKEKFLRS
jgi:GTP-binding protein